MQSIAPASDMKIKPGTAEGIVKVIKKATSQSGQQRALRQAVKMTELSDERLAVVAGKMTDKEKRNMLKAIKSLTRVAQAVQPVAK